MEKSVYSSLTAHVSLLPRMSGSYQSRLYYNILKFSWKCQSPVPAPSIWSRSIALLMRYFPCAVIQFCMLYRTFSAPSLLLTICFHRSLFLATLSSIPATHGSTAASGDLQQRHAMPPPSNKMLQRNVLVRQERRGCYKDSTIVVQLLDQPFSFCLNDCLPSTKLFAVPQTLKQYRRHPKQIAVSQNSVSSQQLAIQRSKW
jgi:hypothetical protein